MKQQLKTNVMNNEQFRKSITELVNKSHHRSVIKLRKVERELKKNPRSFTLKEERIGALRNLQSYEHIKYHIDCGSLDSVEYYDKFIDPLSDYQRELDKDLQNL